MNIRTAPIAAWLIRRVAVYADLPIYFIDPTMPLAELSIDSVGAVGLCGEIEDRFDLDLDPTVVFDYPSIEHIAEFLAREIEAARGVA